MASPDGQEAGNVISVYELQGIEQGIVAGKRDDLSRLLTLKFGQLPDAVREKIASIDEVPTLDALLDKTLFALSLDEMGM